MGEIRIAKGPVNMRNNVNTVAAVVALALLSACGSEKPGEAGSTENMGSTARTDVTIPVAGGSKMRVQDGVSQDAALPHGFGKPEGSSMLRTSEVDGGPGVGKIVSAEMEMPGGVVEGTAWCKREMSRLGIKVETDVSGNGNAVLMGHAANGDRLTISIRPGDRAGTAVVGISSTGKSG
jgi:hypothetical protein